MEMKYQPQRSGKSFNRDSEFQVDEGRLIKVLAGEAKELNEYAKYLAESFVKGKEGEQLSTSQIRNILDEIQRMKTFDENRLQLLRPKLAYLAGKHRGRVKDFQRLLDVAINKTNAGNFVHFKNFVEAIVAYHRYLGGK